MKESYGRLARTVLPQIVEIMISASRSDIMEEGDEEGDKEHDLQLGTKPWTLLYMAINTFTKVREISEDKSVGLRVTLRGKMCVLWDGVN